MSFESGGHLLVNNLQAAFRIKNKLDNKLQSQSFTRKHSVVKVVAVAFLIKERSQLPICHQVPHEAKIFPASLLIDHWCNKQLNFPREFAAKH